VASRYAELIAREERAAEREEKGRERRASLTSASGRLPRLPLDSSSSSDEGGGARGRGRGSHDAGSSDASSSLRSDDPRRVDERMALPERAMLEALSEAKARLRERAAGREAWSVDLESDDELDAVMPDGASWDFDPFGDDNPDVRARVEARKLAAVESRRASTPAELAQLQRETSAAQKRVLDSAGGARVTMLGRARKIKMLAAQRDRAAKEEAGRAAARGGFQLYGPDDVAHATVARGRPGSAESGRAASARRRRRLAEERRQGRGLLRGKGLLTEAELLGGTVSSARRQAEAEEEARRRRKLGGAVFKAEVADGGKCAHCHELPARFKSLNTNARLCQRCVIWLHGRREFRHHRIKPLLPASMTEGLMVRRAGQAAREEEAKASASAAGATLLKSLRRGRGMVGHMKSSVDVVEREKRALAERAAEEAERGGQGPEPTAAERVARARAARERSETQGKADAGGGGLLQRLRSARDVSKASFRRESHRIDVERRELDFIVREDLLDEGDPAMAEVRARAGRAEERRAAVLRRAKEIELETMRRLVDPLAEGRAPGGGGYLRPGSRDWLMMMRGRKPPARGRRALAQAAKGRPGSAGSTMAGRGQAAFEAAAALDAKAIRPGAVTPRSRPQSGFPGTRAGAAAPGGGGVAGFGRPAPAGPKRVDRVLLGPSLGDLRAVARAGASAPARGGPPAGGRPGSAAALGQTRPALLPRKSAAGAPAAAEEARPRSAAGSAAAGRAFPGSDPAELPGGSTVAMAILGGDGSRPPTSHVTADGTAGDLPPLPAGRIASAAAPPHDEEALAAPGTERTDRSESLLAALRAELPAALPEDGDGQADPEGAARREARRRERREGKEERRREGLERRGRRAEAARQVADAVRVAEAQSQWQQAEALAAGMPGDDGDGDGGAAAVAAGRVRGEAAAEAKARRRRLMAEAGVPADLMGEAEDGGLLFAVRRGGAGDVSVRADQAVRAAASGATGAVVLAARSVPSGPHTDMLTGVSNLPGALSGAYGGRSAGGPSLTDAQRQATAVARYGRAMHLIEGEGGKGGEGRPHGEGLLDMMRGHGQARVAAARAAATDDIFERAGLDPHRVGANRNAKKETQLKEEEVARRKLARQAARERAQDAARRRVQAMHREPPELEMAAFFARQGRVAEAEKTVRGVMEEQLRVLGTADRALALTYAVTSLVNREAGRPTEAQKAVGSARDVLAGHGAHPAAKDAVRVAVEEGELLRSEGKGAAELALLRAAADKAVRVQNARRLARERAMARLRDPGSDDGSMREVRRAARAEVEGVTEALEDAEVEAGVRALEEATERAREAEARSAMFEEDDVERARSSKAGRRARRASVNAQRDMQWRIRRGSVTVRPGEEAAAVRAAGNVAARRARMSVVGRHGDALDEGEESDGEEDAGDDGAGGPGRLYQIRLRPSREELEAVMEEPRWRELLRKEMKKEGSESEMDFLLAVAEYRDRAMASAAGAGGAAPAGAGSASSVGADAARINQRYVASGTLSTVPVGARRRAREELETGAKPDSFDEIRRIVRVSIVRGPLKRFWASKRGLRYRAERALSLGLPTWTLEQVAKLAAPSKARRVAKLQGWCRAVVAQAKFAVILRAARLRAEEEAGAEAASIRVGATEMRDARRRARRERLKRAKRKARGEDGDGDAPSPAGGAAASRPSDAARQSDDAAGSAGAGASPVSSSARPGPSPENGHLALAEPAEESEDEEGKDEEGKVEGKEAVPGTIPPAGPGAGYPAEPGPGRPAEPEDPFAAAEGGGFSEAATASAAAQAAGFYDEAGNWVDTAAAQGGYFDAYGTWVDSSAAQAAGYYDEAGSWVDTSAQAAGYYDEAGNWVDTSAQAAGYYDEAGNWVDTSAQAAGYYDAAGNWTQYGGSASAAGPGTAALPEGVTAVDEYGYQHTAEGYYDPSGAFTPYEAADGGGGAAEGGADAAAGEVGEAGGGGGEMPADGREWGGEGGTVLYDDLWGYHDDHGYWDAANEYHTWPDEGAERALGAALEAEGAAVDEAGGGDTPVLPPIR